MHDQAAQEDAYLHLKKKNMPIIFFCAIVLFLTYTDSGCYGENSKQLSTYFHQELVTI